jgi:hypothetical protein
MARPGNQDMSRRRRAVDVMAKSDFVFMVEAQGWKVRQERRKREGWNDTTATFVVRQDGSEVEVFDAMKGERSDWNRAFDDVMKA